ncbi:MAG: hypothetical protein A2X48_04575 [Lentisphaerae bacterium GWF2_49_21]|nr:MAG: hypothetical protein A2X48_04575 [Lentisphaerae bacterium GWF2_49_21]
MDYFEFATGHIFFNAITCTFICKIMELIGCFLHKLIGTPHVAIFKWQIKLSYPFDIVPVESPDFIQIVPVAQASWNNKMD